MKAKTDRQWNKDVAMQIKNLATVKQWLNRWIENKNTDWESQKSAQTWLNMKCGICSGGKTPTNESSI
jgi:hypothetical protein